MELWLTFVALYAWQCTLRLAVPGAIFGPRWLGEADLHRMGAQLLSPWPSTLGAVATPLPFELSRDARSLEVVDATGLGGARTLPLDPLDLERHQTRLRIAGGAPLRAASRAQAIHWEACMRRLSATEGAERPRAFDACLDRSLDHEALAESLAAARRSTRWLAWLCDLLLLLMLLGVPATGVVFGSDYALAIHLPVIGSLYLVAVALAYLAHRRLFPERRGERAEELFMAAFYPPALLRRPQAFVDAATTGYHPLAWVRVLAGEDAARTTWLREVARLERLAARDQARSERAAREAAAVKTRMPAGWTLRPARAAQDPMAASYCPICWDDFRPGFERCGACDADTIPYDTAPAAET